MTEAEFLAILGPEWGVGQGKVDWFDYCEGKVSTQYVADCPGIIRDMGSDKWNQQAE